MASLRSGMYGSYYGSLFSESEALNTEQMTVNAKYIYSYLTVKGWHINAISALLGNMQAESTINPGRWQSESVGNTSGGYSLVQWTPATKYIEWCTANGLNDPSEMDNALARIIYEVNNGIQWIATDAYPISFEEFTKGGYLPAQLAVAFLLNYERPAEQGTVVQAYRGTLANAWYEVLTGYTPDIPVTPTTRSKRKFNFLLMNARKRRSTWIKKPF